MDSIEETFRLRCDECDGAGQIGDQTCPVCRGMGGISTQIREYPTHGKRRKGRKI